MKILVPLFLIAAHGSFAQQTAPETTPEQVNKKLDALARQIKLLEGEKKIATLNLQIAEIREKIPTRKKTVRRKVTSPPIKIKSLFREGERGWTGVFDLRGAKARGNAGDVIFGRYKIITLTSSGASVTDMETSKTYRVRQ